MPNPQYLQQAKKVKMYYDPRGQVVKTENPDGTQQLRCCWRCPITSATPHLQTTLDRGKHQPTHGKLHLRCQRPCPKSTSRRGDYLLPIIGPCSSSLLDPLGRTIRTVDRNEAKRQTSGRKYEFDIRNLKKVTDALGRIALRMYDLKPKSGEEDQGANILKTTHIDSGTKTALFDAAFRPANCAMPKAHSSCMAMTN